MGWKDRRGLPPGRSALGASRRTRARDLRADEARPRRALRRRGGEGRRHAARRRPCVSPRSGRPRHLPPLRRGDPGAQGPALGRRGRVGERAPARRGRPREGRSLAHELRLAGADVRGYVPKESSPSSTAALPRSCSRRATKASACRSSRRWRAARRSSPRRTRRSARSLGTLRSSRSRPSSPAPIRAALDDRDRLVAAGLERARLYTWAETARRTLDVYRELL